MYLLIRFHRACQDLSKAGLGKGMEKGSGTRSGMLWEVERILDECEELPQVLLMENVPDVIGTKNIKHFSNWLEKLESLGYKCFWKVLNGKDYGVPQNRERCFMVSILGDYCYEFPEPIKLEKRLKDLLEDEVDEKFYLSDRAISGIQNTTFNCSTLEARTEKDGVIPTLCARDYKDPKLVIEEPKCVQVAQLEGGFESTGRVYSPNGISPTITTCGGGNTEPKVMLNGVVKIGNYSPSGHNAASIVHSDGCAPTVMENHGTVTATNVLKSKNYRIRKLTPRECFRLQGVKDCDFERIAKNQSNTSLYHLAGDSIITLTLCAIFVKMFPESTKKLEQVLHDFYSQIKRKEV